MADIPVLEAAPGQDGLSAPPRKRTWLTVSLILIVVLAGAGAGLGYFLGVGRSEHALSPGNIAAAKAPPIYVPLDPPFVVNFEAEQLVRFLQVTVQIMSRDPQTVEILKANDPVVRNDLLLLLGNQRYETIATREGKERLRAQALETVRRVVTRAGGKGNLVEAVYFTSFVMQ